MLSSNKSILQLLARKLYNNKWMIVSLLIGNILLIATVASIPLYGSAVMQRVLTKDFEQYQQDKNIYPGRIDFTSTMRHGKTDILASIEQTENMLLDEMLPNFGINRLEMARVATMSDIATPEVLRDRYNTKSVILESYSDIEQHIEITNGKLFSHEPVNGEVEVIAPRKTLEAMNVLLGESLTCARVTLNGKPLVIRIVGIYTNKEGSDLYWRNAPKNLINNFILPSEIWNTIVSSGELEQNFNIDCSWHIALDYYDIKVANVANILSTHTNYVEKYKKNQLISYRNYFTGVMQNYDKEMSRFNMTLWVLEAPTFIFLCSFIFMVSKKIIGLERNEIALFKSRGASRGQIILLYLYQGVIITLASIAIGIPIGVLICRTIGASDGFLGFVRRTALPVTLNAESFIFPALAGVVSMLTMLVPAIKASKITIVGHKQTLAAAKKSPLWKKAFFDVIILGFSIYILYDYTMQRDAMSLVGDSARLDPMLFLSSSLFMIGAGLFALRIFPLLIKLIYFVGKKMWSPSLYASFLNVSRSAGDEGFIMMFLILTISIGIYYSQMARTINQNLEDKVRYAVGADVRLKEKWDDNAVVSTSITGATTSSAATVFYEPDFGRFQNIPDVKMTKVYIESRASVFVDGGNVNATLLGIHTREFGEIARLRGDLLPVHWFNYLNTMAKAPNAVLVSENLKTLHGCKIGDALRYRNKAGQDEVGIVYGFVPYFPSYSPKILTKQQDGLFKETEQYLVVANLANLQNSWGVLPYEVWFGAKGDSADNILNFTIDNELQLTMYRNAADEIVREKNKPLNQGTNGVLTIGFVITLAVAMAGFLIYWILSIKGRVLQFGLFRAMGMSRLGVIGILVNEQFLISVVAILIGVGVGQLTGKLFVPLILIGYSSHEQMIPLQIVSQVGDYLRLFGIIGFIFVCCLFILNTIINKIKIGEALKLGED